MSSLIHDALQLLEPMLQEQVCFNIDHKTTRKGRLILFNVIDYHVKFTISSNKNTIKTYEVPYPFKVTTGEGFVKFSYKIADFCNGNTRKEELVRMFEPVTNKLYDKNLILVKANN